MSQITSIQGRHIIGALLWRTIECKMFSFKAGFVELPWLHLDFNRRSATEVWPSYLFIDDFWRKINTPAWGRTDGKVAILESRSFWGHLLVVYKHRHVLWAGWLFIVNWSNFAWTSRGEAPIKNRGLHCTLSGRSLIEVNLLCKLSGRLKHRLLLLYKLIAFGREFRL